jgi:hypothetical protein
MKAIIIRRRCHGSMKAWLVAGMKQLKANGNNVNNERQYQIESEERNNQAISMALLSAGAK